MSNPYPYPSANPNPDDRDRSQLPTLSSPRDPHTMDATSGEPASFPVQGDIPGGTVGVEANFSSHSPARWSPVHPSPQRGYHIGFHEPWPRQNQSHRYRNTLSYPFPPSQINDEFSDETLHRDTGPSRHVNTYGRRVDGVAPLYNTGAPYMGENGPDHRQVREPGLLVIPSSSRLTLDHFGGHYEEDDSNRHYSSRLPGVDQDESCDQKDHSDQEPQLQQQEPTAQITEHAQAETTTTNFLGDDSKTTPKEATCPFDGCNTTKLLKRNFAVHLRKRHYQGMSTNDMVRCGVGGCKRGPMKLGSIRKHTLTHLGLTSEHCQHCGKKVRSCGMVRHKTVCRVLRTRNVDMGVQGDDKTGRKRKKRHHDHEEDGRSDDQPGHGQKRRQTDK